jgi:CcmD family protein
MTSFIVAYLAVWLSVTFYILRLGQRQRSLSRTLGHEGPKLCS